MHFALVLLGLLAFGSEADAFWSWGRRRSTGQLQCRHCVSVTSSNPVIQEMMGGSEGEALSCDGDVSQMLLVNCDGACGKGDVEADLEIPGTGISGDVHFFTRSCVGRAEMDARPDLFTLGCHEGSKMSEVLNAEGDAFSNLSGEYCLCEEEAC